MVNLFDMYVLYAGCKTWYCENCNERVSWWWRARRTDRFEEETSIWQSDWSSFDRSQTWEEVITNEQYPIPNVPHKQFLFIEVKDFVVSVMSQLNRIKKLYNITGQTIFFAFGSCHSHTNYLVLFVVSLSISCEKKSSNLIIPQKFIFSFHTKLWLDDWSGLFFRLLFRMTNKTGNDERERENWEYSC